MEPVFFYTCNLFGIVDQFELICDEIDLICTVCESVWVWAHVCHMCTYVLGWVERQRRRQEELWWWGGRNTCGWENG